MNKKYLWLIKLFFVGNLLAIITFWYHNSPIGPASTVADGLVSLGRICGLLLAYLLLIQLILISRLKIIEGALGHDKLARWHRNLGISAALFLLAHPILLAFGYALNNSLSWSKQLYNFVFVSEALTGAVLATGLLIFIILVSSRVIGRRWRYEIWYFIHLFVYLAIFAAFGHQVELGGDFSQNAFLIYWYALFIFFWVLYGYARFLKPLNNLRRFRFQVSRIVPESDSIYSIFITGRHLEKFSLVGGQFGIFRFLQKGLWFEAHPFSFSRCLKDNEIRISIKKLGNFTEKLPDKLKIGTTVFIEGPLGVFTARPKKNKYLLISGGIGITPICSLAEELAKQKKDVRIFSALKNPAEEVFGAEMSELASTANFSYYRFYSEQTSDQAEQNIFAGRVKLEKIKSLVPDWREREIYFCGPPAMSTALNKELRQAGASKKQLHWERFNF